MARAGDASREDASREDVSREDASRDTVMDARKSLVAWRRAFGWLAGASAVKSRYEPYRGWWPRGLR